MTTINTGAVADYLRNLQDNICQKFTDLDGSQFVQDNWKRSETDASLGGGRTRVLETDNGDGKVIAKGGVNFSHIYGSSLPPSATKARPELAGRSFEALGVSVVMHPHNPYVPTSHANVRFFIAYHPTQQPIWWFGGGFDLTPYYGFEEDCIHWHQSSKSACNNDDELYRRLKKQCDDYFYLPHRNEPRGVGGLFFDDLNHLGFEKSFEFIRSVGNYYTLAYMPIVKRRKDMPYGAKEVAFQQYRRGRYVEFNLLHDRGTLFGIQSQGRTESILMSLPPNVQWKYNYRPERDSVEHELLEKYLVVGKDWI